MKYYFGFIAILIILFIGVKLIFSGGKKTPTTPTTTSSNVSTKPSKLADYASTNAEVSVTISGPITANELHNSVKITVSRDERTVDVMNGYDNLLIRSKSYDNTQSAYDAFLRAIDSFGFTREQKSKIADERDTCPLGNHYAYELSNTGFEDQDKRMWSVSCGITFGTAAGIGPTLRSLFKQQIVDYNTFTQDIGL